MKSKVSKLVQQLKPSGIRAFFDLVLGMKDVVSLGVGEPDFVTPWQIREAGIYSLEQGFTSYTSNKGLYKLRLSLSRFIKQHYGVEYCPDEEILITVGVSEAIDLGLRAVLEPQDKVLIPIPAFVSYGPVTELAGGIPVYIDTKKDGFKLTPKNLSRHIDKKVKAIILNYPNNPTGVSYTRKELEALKKIIVSHGIICFSDEVYGDLTYDFKHTCFSSLAHAKPLTVYLNGFSKSFAMTGWRVGYACGPKDIIAAMTKIHQYTIMCVSITSQMAAAEALAVGYPSVEEMKKEYNRRRQFVCAGLNRMGIKVQLPQGAFYVFADISLTGMKSLDFAQLLLKEEKVAVVPGTAFGENFNDYIRISYASGFEQIKEALIRMERFLARNKRRRKG